MGIFLFGGVCLIKLSKYIYIHWLTVGLFVSAYITRTLGMTAIMYLVMLLHELAHAAAALYLKAGVSKIILYPFGVSIRLGTRMLCSFADELVLYLSGPLVNAFLALVMVISGHRNLFCINNLVIFCLNLLPILPLDGGRIAEAGLLRIVGEKATRRIMIAISAVISAAVVGALIVHGAVNVNTMSFCLFIAGGVLTQKPKYSRDYVRELAMAGKRKKTMKAELFVADENIPKRKLIGEFSPVKNAVVVFCDSDGAVTGIGTDASVLQDVLNK